VLSGGGFLNVKESRLTVAIEGTECLNGRVEKMPSLSLQYNKSDKLVEFAEVSNLIQNLFPSKCQVESIEIMKQGCL
jgi:hypothetical protein